MFSNKTYFSGYYGMLNSGDDALLHASIWGAEKFLDLSNFLVSTPRPMRLADGRSIQPRLVAEQKFRGENRLRQYLSSIGVSRVIFGGGSVLHSHQDIEIKRHLLKLGRKNSGMAIGVGIGPFKNEKAEKSCVKFLKECKFVGVRDPESFEIARSIAPDANVKLTFDLAPALVLSQRFPRMQQQRSGIGVCLCPVERLQGDNATESRRIKRIATLVEHIHRKSGEPVTLIDFNGHHQLGDRQVHQEMASYLSNKVPVNYVAYDPDPFALMAEIAKKKLIIGMRLHASVFSFLTETPLYSIDYHRKCTAWCNQIGLAEEAHSPMGNDDVYNAVQYCLDGLENGFEKPALTVDRATHLALKNWR